MRKTGYPLARLSGRAKTPMLARRSRTRGSVFAIAKTPEGGCFAAAS
jgi:hypothetical protein